MKEVEFSFCLPVYNVKDFVVDALESISSQFENSDSVGYEILCCDDCSVDGTYELLMSVVCNFPALRIMRNEKNTGMCYTRNQMMREAKGKYIWFVDPDDMLYPGIIQTIIPFLSEKEPDVLLGNYVRIGEYEKRTFPKQDSFTVHHNSSLEKLPTDDKGIRMGTVWGGVFKREFLLSNQIFFNEKMIAQEDTLFYFEFRNRTSDIYKFDEVCYIYRQRSTSVSHAHSIQRSLKYYNSMLELYKVYQSYLQEGKCVDEEGTLDRLTHMKQSLALTLAAVYDTKYVRSELAKLKRMKIYPYSFTKRYINSSDSVVQKLLTYMLPFELDFYVLHYLYKIRHVILKKKRG